MSRNFMRYYFLGILLVALDQITKAAVQNICLWEIHSVIGEFFQLTHVENSGRRSAYSAGRECCAWFTCYEVLPFALWYFHRHKGDHWTLYCSWSLVIAGGVGNLRSTGWSLEQ